MKRIICFILTAALVLCACVGGYAEPDVTELVNSIIEGQDIDEPAFATAEETALILGIDPEKVEESSFCYSGSGGYSDTVVVIKLYDAEDAADAEKILSDYKASRYEDFKGYAPKEAEKAENGRVIVRGRYAVLMILPDIDLALSAAEEAFKA